MSTGAHAATGAAVVDDLGTDAVRGLTGAEAATRHRRHGPNRWVVPRRVTFLRVLTDEVTEPMMLLLAAIAVLYGVWGRFDDTVAVVVIIAAVVGVEVFAEFRAKSVIASLGELTAPTTPVVRDGSTVSVDVTDVVPGDLVPLAAGSRVPADLRLVESWGLRVDESTLTGEPVAAPKDAARVLPGDTALAERANLVFAGTTVVAGRARGVVVATGTATELGTLTGLVVAARPPRTPLQQAMRELAGSLATLAIAFSVLVPLIGVLTGRPWREMVLTGLTLAFATVPEELPIIVSLVLGLGAHRLSRRRGLVRRLRAAEALGLVTVLATDKTGTLTRNRMAVARIEPAPGTDGDTVVARADVGVAMGSSGTDVAREAAGLVLADDDVATLTRALHEGRTLHGNLRKGVAYYLACKAGLVATVAAGVLTGMAVPFTPIQIVVLEMFMDIAGSATFAAEPAERDAMTRPPRDPGARFLDRDLLGDLAAGAVALFVAVGGLYLVTASQTVAFVAWLSGHLALAWVMRTERTPVLRSGLFANRFLPWWTVVTAAAVWVATTVPALRDTLRLTPLTGPQWIAAVLVPVAAVAVLELRKAGRQRAATARPAG